MKLCKTGKLDYMVSMQRCARVTKSLCWVSKEVCDMPSYEGIPNLDTLIIDFEVKVPE